MATAYIGVCDSAGGGRAVLGLGGRGAAVELELGPGAEVGESCVVGEPALAAFSVGSSPLVVAVNAAPGAASAARVAAALLDAARAHGAERVCVVGTVPWTRRCRAPVSSLGFGGCAAAAGVPELPGDAVLRDELLAALAALLRAGVMPGRLLVAAGKKARAGAAPEEDGTAEQLDALGAVLAGELGVAYETPSGAVLRRMGEGVEALVYC